MIFYFSATGNSKYVAERIAERTGDTLCSVTERLSGDAPEYTAAAGETIGLVTPVYFWKLPSVVKEFLETARLSAPEDAYIWLVATYGALSGGAGAEVKRLLAKKGLRLGASFGVCMPDTWTVMFDLSDKAKVAAKNDAASAEIESIAERIAAGERGSFLRGRAPGFAAAIAYASYGNARLTKHLRVSPACTGCGLCAEQCPVSAIELRERRPVWIKERCAMCLGCLHKCPAFAIQYDNKTQTHGQYQHPSALKH